MNKVHLLKIINFTFKSTKYSGNQIRAWLQTARDVKASGKGPYGILTKEEFEALFRIYRFFWREGEWLAKDSYDPTLLNRSTCFDKAKNEISKAVSSSDIFPVYQDKVKVRVFGSEEFDWH